MLKTVGGYTFLYFDHLADLDMLEAALAEANVRAVPHDTFRELSDQLYQLIEHASVPKYLREIKLDVDLLRTELTIVKNGHIQILAVDPPSLRRQRGNPLRLNIIELRKGPRVLLDAISLKDVTAGENNWMLVTLLT